MIDERLHAQVRVPLEIFPHTVEDYDRIVNRKSEDRQKRCDKQAIDFNSQKMTKRRENPDRYREVVDERDNSRRTEMPCFYLAASHFFSYLPESVRNIKDDTENHYNCFSITA